jgi:hypothetical protein
MRQKMEMQGRCYVITIVTFSRINVRLHSCTSDHMSRLHQCDVRFSRIRYVVKKEAVERVVRIGMNVIRHLKMHVHLTGM